MSSIQPAINPGDVEVTATLEPAARVVHRLAVQLPVEPDVARVGDHALEVDAAALAHRQVLRVPGEVEIVQRQRRRHQVC